MRYNRALVRIFARHYGVILMPWEMRRLAMRISTSRNKCATLRQIMAGR